MSDQYDELSELQRLVADVKPFSFGINKMFEIGYLLKCYYGLQKYYMTSDSKKTALVI
jgi:hypothetical protein